MSKIRRSVYQKLAEENKRLLKDIEVLVMKPFTQEGRGVKKKWYEKFRKDKEFNELLKKLVTKPKIECIG